MRIIDIYRKRHDNAFNNSLEAVFASFKTPTGSGTKTGAGLGGALSAPGAPHKEPVSDIGRLYTAYRLQNNNTAVRERTERKAGRRAAVGRYGR